MSARERVMKNFSRAASQYDALAQLQHRQSHKMAEIAMRYLPEAATLIDIGCGTGQFAKHSKQQKPQWQVVGLDFAYGMCREAQKRCNIAQADAASLPIASDSCDGAVSSLCLQWLDPLAPAIEEINRALKPGGTAIIVTLGNQTLKELHEASQAADLSLRLKTLAPKETYQEALLASQFDILEAHQEIEVEHHESVRALLDSMRAIGAGADAEKLKGFAGANRWRAMLEQYETLRTAQGLPLSWQHLTFVARKRA